MTKSKLINVHDNRNVMIILKIKKYKTKVKQEMSEKPVMLCGKVMKIIQYDRYLGEAIRSSLKESLFLAS